MNMYFDEDNNYFIDEHEFNFKTDIDSNININVDSINFNRDNTLYDPNEGFNKGNMFKNLYSKYKNYVYNLKVNNPKDELLYKIQMYTFALKDLNLYLDVYPEDRNMLKMFQEYKSKLEEYKNKYINEYGPLYSNNVNILALIFLILVSACILLIIS